MSQVPIDQLPAATIPLAGSEPLALVQNGVTRQAPASAISSSTGTLAYSIQSASFSATSGLRYALITATNAITITLPTPVLGAAIEISDVSHKADVHNIILNAGSNSIVYQATTASTQTISTPGAVVRLICYTTATWRALVIGSA